MCGRYTLTNPAQMALQFDVRADDAARLAPHYNIAPTQAVPVVVQGAQGRALSLMRWGFQPAWATANPGRPAPINARAETLLERPLFRGAVATARCLIPADGFYEWQQTPGGRAKQPFYIRRRDGDLFGFAGLYTTGTGREGEPIMTCAIVTTAPNALMAPIHNRMPAILDAGDVDLWLDPALTDPHPALTCLRSYPAEQLVAFPVSSLVSSARNDGPALVEPLAVQ